STAALTPGMPSLARIWARGRWSSGRSAMEALRWMRRGRRRRARGLASAVGALRGRRPVWSPRSSPPRRPRRSPSGRSAPPRFARSSPSRRPRRSPSGRSAPPRFARSSPSRRPRRSPSGRSAPPRFARSSPPRRPRRSPSRRPPKRSPSRRPRPPANFVVTRGSLRPDPMISRVSGAVRSSWSC
ncbi:uncharacterized protein METZ01_LOCUS421623, partial [marine metagenome]